MTKFSRYLLLALVMGAIFLIFNCAGYLLVTLLINDTTPSYSGSTAADNQLALTRVAFSTAAPVSATVTTAATSPAAAEPLPLLPTITPGGPTLTPTPLPPATASPTTPTSTATRLPAATAAPGQLEVVSHHSYVDSLGWYHIVGEVRNNAHLPMEYVEVLAKLYDDQNEAIGTKLTFTAPDLIFPGGSAPFDIVALRQSQWRNISYYQLTVKGDATREQTQQSLILLSQNSTIENGLMVVAGEVQNTGQQAALAKLIVTLYDSERNVINTSWSYANAGIIPVDSSSAFEVKINHDIDQQNFQYRIQIEEELIEKDSK